MFPIVAIPTTIHAGLAPYRDLFYRDQGDCLGVNLFGPVSIPCRECGAFRQRLVEL